MSTRNEKSEDKNRDDQNGKEEGVRQPRTTGNKDDVNREWEEAQKHQEENALRPGVDMDDMEQHDEEGNPKEF